MSPPEKLLTQREFDAWREDDRALKERILDYMDQQDNLNRESEGRISTLEAGCDKNKKVGWISMAIALITGMATVLAAMYGG